MKSEAVAAIKEKDMHKNPDEWQVKNWADTVMEGEAIKTDKKKMKHVGKHLKKMHHALGKVVKMGPVKSTDDLRARAKEMAVDDGGDE